MTEVQTENSAGVAGQGQNLLAGRRVPELDGLILATVSLEMKSLYRSANSVDCKGSTSGVRSIKKGNGKRVVISLLPSLLVHAGTVS